MTDKDSRPTAGLVLAHLGLMVEDAERSARFYEQVLGLTVGTSLDTDRLKLVNLHIDGLTIELLEYHPAAAVKPRSGSFDHLAFTVSDLDAAIQRLQLQGVAFETEVPRLAATGQRIIFCAGPDGERIELMEG